MFALVDVHKSFVAPAGPVKVLRGASLTVQSGEFLAVVGKSGSGKSTLLNVMSTLVTPDAGQALFEGRELRGAPESEIRRLRGEAFAMVFQAHHLIPYLTVLENVLLPHASGIAPVSAAHRRRAEECLEAVGLLDKARSLPLTLSGGEQQRAAIARGLAKGARVLFADEPTGSLDAATADSIMELFTRLHKNGLTIIMVTHNQDYARLASRTVTISEGRILE